LNSASIFFTKKVLHTIQVEAIRKFFYFILKFTDKDFFMHIAKSIGTLGARAALLGLLAVPAVATRVSGATAPNTPTGDRVTLLSHQQGTCSDSAKSVGNPFQRLLAKGSKGVSKVDPKPPQGTYVCEADTTSARNACRQLGYPEIRGTGLNCEEWPMKDGTVVTTPWTECTLY
jgi:hypothetical protein